MTLRDFRVTRDDLRFVGSNLRRPECVLPECADVLWVSDSRGGLTRIGPDGQTLLRQHGAAGSAPSCPNGLAFASDGGFLIANIGTKRLEHMSRSGTTESVFDRFEGQNLGLVNFVLRDHLDRTWISVSTQRDNLLETFRPDCPDGRIFVRQRDGITRLFADGLHFPNEMRLHPSGGWLYVAETTAKRIRRIKIESNDVAGEAEVVGPGCLGHGFPDGIQFDCLGNLWIAMLGADRVDVLFPDGSLTTVLDDGRTDRQSEVDKCFYSGTLTFADLLSGAGTLAPLFTSVAFGGPHNSIAFIGSLNGTHLLAFDTPVSGPER